MCTLRFNYTDYRGTKVPIIPVELGSKGEWFNLWAFVDSGATYSIFALKYATAMGLQIEKAKQRMVVVGDGSFIPVYFLKIPIRIGNVKFNAEIGFSDRLRVGFNLLGRKDIFEQFTVCLSDKDMIVTFYEEP